MIPVDALLDEQDQRATVFAIRDGIARKSAIVLGQRLDREVQVLEALAKTELPATNRFVTS